MRQKLLRGQHRFQLPERQDVGRWCPRQLACSAGLSKPDSLDLPEHRRFSRGERDRAKAAGAWHQAPCQSRLTPVIFPPGRLSEATSPPFTPSELDVYTIGIFDVATFAARATTSPPVAAITATGILTSSAPPVRAAAPTRRLPSNIRSPRFVQ